MDRKNVHGAGNRERKPSHCRVLVLAKIILSILALKGRRVVCEALARRRHLDVLDSRRATTNRKPVACAGGLGLAPKLRRQLQSFFTWLTLPDDAVTYVLQVG